MKYCIIVDAQNDFCTGALANPDFEKIIPDMVKKVEELREQGYVILATRDTHSENYMNTQEGKNLPVPHCIAGTSGWEVVDELKPFIDEYVDKPSFGYNKWVEFFGDHKPDCPDEIVMMGTCTGICVASNFAILKANYPEIPISVYKDLCACLTPESHEAAINTMKVQQAIIK